MGRFYETVFYDTPQPGRVLGWQLLASPPDINQQAISYTDLVDDLGEITPIEALGGLEVVFALIGDPSQEWSRVGTRPLRAMGGPTNIQPGYARELLAAPVFAAETSPLGAASVSKLASLATTTGVAVVDGHAALVFVGARLGLVVIRGLGAVGGAVWDGSRPEIVAFSGDVTASLLMALRRRLGITARPAGADAPKKRTP
jgi:hypothetical protein